jgi:hypothetical protein
MFNHPETYTALADAGLHLKWSAKKAVKILQARKEDKHQVFTGAYIITNNGLKESKIVLVCNSMTEMWQKRKHAARHLMAENSLEYAVGYMTGFPMVGKFISYELVTDFRWTPLLDRATDIYTWANPGPGAFRGLNRIYGRPLKKAVKYPQATQEMRDLLELSTKRGKLKSHMQPLEMRDIEHSLCEFDKYMRVKLGEGKPRSKYK